MNLKTKKDASFIIIKSEEGFFKEQARILICWRYNSTLGFPGGETEEGETPLEGAIRECEEEMNYKIRQEDINKIEPLLTLKAKDGRTIHSFVLTLPKEEITEIVKNSRDAKDSLFEVCGINDYMLYDQSLEKLVTFPFAGTARQELKALLEKMNYKHATLSLEQLFSKEFFVNQMNKRLDAI